MESSAVFLISNGCAKGARLRPATFGNIWDLPAAVWLAEPRHFLNTYGNNLREDVVPVPQLTANFVSVAVFFVRGATPVYTENN